MTEDNKEKEVPVQGAAGNSEKTQEKHSVRDSVYSNLPFTVKQMDWIIGGLLILLAAVLFVGIFIL